MPHKLKLITLTFAAIFLLAAISPANAQAFKDYQPRKAPPNPLPTCSRSLSKLADYKDTKRIYQFFGCKGDQNPTFSVETDKDTGKGAIHVLIPDESPKNLNAAAMDLSGLIALAHLNNPKVELVKQGSIEGLKDKSRFKMALERQ